jgi:hypothetical protein
MFQGRCGQFAIESVRANVVADVTAMVGGAASHRRASEQSGPPEQLPA